MSESTPAASERKTCSKCGERKEIRHFARGKGGTFAGQCKACRAEYMRSYRQSTPLRREKAIALSAEYYRKNRERMIADAIEYEKRNPRKRRRNYDPERRREQDRAYYAANRERVDAVKRAWRENNAELVAETRRRTMARRRAHLRGLPSERYTMDELLDRDGTSCVLCSEELDLDAVHPDPLSPTVEHLECISWPGSAGDVLTNVAVAHYRCNNHRRANPHPAAARKRAELLASG